jgi:basic membrane protein A
MSKKLYVLFALLIVAAMALSACGGAEATEADCPEEDVFCVGLVTDVGEVDDKGFNQAAWEALEQSKEDGVADFIKYVETKDAKDYQPNMELFAAAGYDVIVTSGYALATDTNAMAKKYPNIKFIGTDQFQAEKIENNAGLIFNEDKSGFLAGALAAMMSKTGKIAGVYGTDLIPPVVAFKVGYENGAKYINPAIEVISTFHPGGLDVAFGDPEWGATTAKQAIDQGADIVFGAGGKTGNGALIETAGTAGLFCIGVDLDQWETLPEAHPCLISSAMKMITPGTTDLIKSVKEGTFLGGNNIGPVGLAPFHDFEDTVPQDVKDKLAEIDKGLADGSIPTGYAP